MYNEYFIKRIIYNIILVFFFLRINNFFYKTFINLIRNNIYIKKINDFNDSFI